MLEDNHEVIECLHSGGLEFLDVRRFLEAHHRLRIDTARIM